MAFAGGINYRRLLDEALSSLVLSFLLMYGLPGWLTLSTLLTSYPAFGGDGWAFAGWCYLICVIAMPSGSREPPWAGVR